MAIRPLNSVAGFSVGETPTNIILANGDVTTTNITTTGVSNLNAIGNVKITGGSSGQAITTDGLGNLVFTTIASGTLSNGTSNVTVLNSANITFSSAGNANIMVITGTGVNVAGTFNTGSGNANVGNLGTAQVFATANITTPQVIANIAQGTAPFLVNSNTVVANLNADLLDGFNTATANTASTVAVRDSSGNLSANFFIGNGSQLTGIGSAGSIANGTSNVSIPAVNGNVNTSVGGTANVLVVTATGANILGTLNTGTGNANVGNLGTAQVLASANVTAPQLISNVTTGTAPLVVTSTTRVANLSVAYANVSDFDVVTTQTTGVYYPTFVNAGTTANYALASNTAFTANLANGALLATTFVGNLSGVLANGNSNVSIPAANGNVNISAVGNANILVVTGTGVNVFGTLNTGTGNANVGNIGATTAIFTTGNITTVNSGLVQNGTSNVTIASGANVSTFIGGNATAQFVVAPTGVNVAGTLNAVGNANVGNLGTAQVLATANVTAPTLISNVTTGTAPLTVTSTTRVANLSVAYANVSDFEVVTTQSTGTFYPTFVNGTTTGNYAVASNTAFSANLANGALIATTFVGNLTGNVTSTGPISATSVTATGAASGNANVATVTGPLGIRAIASTYTDNVSAAGTVANAAIHAFGTPTLVASNAITTTNLSTFFIQGAPTASTNVTATNSYALFVAAGNSYLAGNVTFAGNILGVHANGNSNVNIPAANGNVTISAVGTANVLVVTGTGVNVAGTLNTGTGNANVGNLGTGTAIITTGNITTVNTGLVQNGTSNVTIASGANISSFIGGNTTAQFVIAPTGVNVAGYANIVGNANVGNIGGGTAIFTTGNITTVNSGLLQNGTSNVTIASGANVSTFIGGNATAQFVIAATGVNVAGYSNVIGNANVGNLGTAGLIVATGNITSSANLITDNILGRTGALTITSAGTNTNINLKPNGTGNIDANAAFITNVKEPVNPQDAATKYYVDQVAQGLHTHDACQAATPDTLAIITSGTVTYNNGASGVGANLTTTGTFNLIDTVNVQTSGTRILVKNEANTAHNGIYVWSNATVITRADDFDTPTEMAGGDFTFVQAGALYDNTGWVMPDPVTTVGTSPVVWLQFSGAGTYTAGTGLTLTGSVFSITNTTVTPTSYGNGDTVATFTVNAQGQLTAAANVVITANAANLTGTTLASGIVNSSLTSVGTLGSLTVTGNATAGNFVGRLANGNSNVNIPSANGNVTISAIGNANIVVVTGTGVNVAGTFSTGSGNANIGNIGTAQVLATANVTAPQLISNIAAGTAPLVVTSTTRVANLSVAYANVSDFGVVTTQSTGVYYPTFVSAGTTANYALASNTSITANLANSALIATTFVGNVSGNITGVLANGTSNVSIPAVNGNVNIVSAGNTTLVVTGTGANVTGTANISGNLAAGNISATNGNLSVANVSGNIILGNSTVTTTMTWASVTTTAVTANQTISSFSVTGVTGVEFLVKGVDATGSKYSVATVTAVTDGTSVDYSTFGTVSLGGYTGSLAVNISGGFIRLQVTPSSSNSTVWTTQYRLV